MMTIAHVSQKKYREALGATILSEMSSCGKWTMKIVIAVLALVILAVYAFVLYLIDNKSKMGIIIAISVTIMDLFIGLLWLSGMVHSTPGICSLLIMNRILMIICGDNYWLYGYMLLFLVYSAVFVWNWTKRLFPLERDIIVKQASFKDLMKTGF